MGKENRRHMTGDDRAYSAEPNEPSIHHTEIDLAPAPAKEIPAKVQRIGEKWQRRLSSSSRYVPQNVWSTLSSAAGGCP